MITNRLRWRDHLRREFRINVSIPTSVIRTSLPIRMTGNTWAAIIRRTVLGETARRSAASAIVSSCGAWRPVLVLACGFARATRAGLGALLSCAQGGRDPGGSDGRLELGEGRRRDMGISHDRHSRAYGGSRNRGHYIGGYRIGFWIEASLKTQLGEFWHGDAY